MSRLNRYTQVCRATELVLLLVAMIGPWTFDLINVPLQYPCNAPNVRLEGDFCGLPLSGLWIVSVVVSGLGYMIVGLVTRTVVLTDWIQLFLMTLLLVPSILPLISTLLMLSGRYRKRWRVFHILVMGLVVCFSLFVGTNLIGYTRFSRVWWILWGIWLYIGVTVSALILEVLTLISEKRTRLQI